ncbi:50S ribosomal protein L6 [Candidatus Uhrbacteria bacterium CG_4_10_14_0_8_um_filter_58_22]|uniref:Large ribosomal subunit protein uL6 n=1 Tax=Candidatus Uhrbacteria bacterium CG_4_10_14_0_8_um_filter_58_22 TaxID=1975029 RepID=A0A2M7Q9N1_9BACT|nr:MAG: 50S ribosomal protein L6 [Parcubacteria group bacterium CG1_02_58_44]PIY62390.1 MAG: 50S ribosomal protein L6 [Candidatus Uhrbacteria bacterium CG_4_10_14_0_8_um_filter_58_22]
MSRIGKKPISVPSGVEVKLEGRKVTVKGPKGTLDFDIHPHVEVSLVDSMVIVKVQDETNVSDRALWGLFVRLISNMITGVTQGFERKLEVNGVGYKVALQGKTLKLEVGFSHEVNFPVPDGIDMSVEKNVITVTGIDKQFVGETAAQIRRVRKPEPYKGKGIKYLEETIQRKAGKTSKS